MSTYSVKLQRPHATAPTVAFFVTVWDLVNGGAYSELTGNSLYVPAVDTWIPDTLRLVLWELSAYLPAHQPEDAIVRINAKHHVRRGRAPKTPRPAVFDNAVVLSVEARGWRAGGENELERRAGP